MAIQYYYSPSTKGIYSAEVHGAAIPADRVTITPTQYAQVAAGTYSVTVSGGVVTTVAITPQTAGTLNTGIGLATPTSKLHIFVNGSVGANDPAISPLSISTGTVNAQKILIRNDVITSNNWYRLSLPQSYADNPVQTNGGTVTVSVTWHPMHASNSFCQEYKLTYGTEYTLGTGFLSITSVQPVYFGKAKQTYSGYSTSPNVDFEYDATGGYLYFNISGAHPTYNTNKSIKVVVNGKTVSEPQLIQTTAPTGTIKLSKISEIPGGRYSTSIFKEIPVSNPSYLYQYLKLFRHHTGKNGIDTGGVTTHFAGTISAIRSNDLGVTTSSYISVSRTYQGYFLFSQTCNHGKPFELRYIQDDNFMVWLCLRCPQSNAGVDHFTVNGTFTDWGKEDYTQYNQIPFEAMIGGSGTASTFGADISTAITEGTALNNVYYSSVQTDAPAIFKRDVYANENLILNGTGNLKCTTTKQGMIGVYDPQKTQAIWAMGAAYTLGTDTSSTNYGNPGTGNGHHGLAWSYEPGYNGVPENNPQSKAGLSHQLLIQINGTTQTAIGKGIWTIGTVTATSFVGNGITPIGGIIMWSGSIANIPSGWAFCNGSNGTPDLRDKFIIGASADSSGAKTNVTGSLTQTGGSKNSDLQAHTHANTVSSSHNITASQEAHTHLLTAGTVKRLNGGGSTIGNIGQSGTDYNLMQGSSTPDTGNSGSATPAITTAGSVTTSITNVSQGTGTGVDANLPPYYALAYIMRIA